VHTGHHRPLGSEYPERRGARRHIALGPTAPGGGRRVESISNWTQAREELLAFFFLQLVGHRGRFARHVFRRIRPAPLNGRDGSLNVRILPHRLCNRLPCVLRRSNNHRRDSDTDFGTKSYRHCWSYCIAHNVSDKGQIGDERLDVCNRGDRWSWKTQYTTRS
jgi:hypothetical protein